jgi:hypothetical protein
MAGTERGRIAGVRGRHTLRALDPKDRDVGGRVALRQAGRHTLAVRQGDREVLVAFDRVACGNHDTVAPNDAARTETLAPVDGDHAPSDAVHGGG